MFYTSGVRSDRHCIENWSCAFSSHRTQEGRISPSSRTFSGPYVLFIFRTIKAVHVSPETWICMRVSLQEREMTNSLWGSEVLSYVFFSMCNLPFPLNKFWLIPSRRLYAEGPRSCERRWYSLCLSCRSYCGATTPPTCVSGSGKSPWAVTYNSLRKGNTFLLLDRYIALFLWGVYHTIIHRSVPTHSKCK